MVFDEAKSKVKALQLALEFNRQSDEVLNNKLYDVRAKYDINELDWLTVSTAFSVLTTRQMYSKFGGRG